jgi:hypothetical protein
MAVDYPVVSAVDISAVEAGIAKTS